MAETSTPAATRATGGSGHHDSPAAAESCPNCGEPRPGEFCPACGQRQGMVRVSLREMAADFADDQLLLSGKLPRTLVLLLARPGYLTAEYVNRRIARYLRPLRLYIGVSVVFFLLVGLLTSRSLDSGSANPVFRMPADSAAAGDGSAAAGDGTIQIDTSATNVDLGPLSGVVRDRINRINGMQGREVAGRMAANLTRYLPRMMFVLLPVFAFLLKLLYIRRGCFYIEHLVFSLHFHSFLFMLFSAILLLVELPDSPANEMVRLVLVLWGFLYLFLAMRKVYRQPLLKTSAKYGALLFSYLLVLGVAFVAASLMALYFL